MTKLCSITAKALIVQVISSIAAFHAHDCL